MPAGPGLPVDEQAACADSLARARRALLRSDDVLGPGARLPLRFKLVDVVVGLFHRLVGLPREVLGHLLDGRFLPGTQGMVLENVDCLVAEPLQPESVGRYRPGEQHGTTPRERMIMVMNGHPR